MIQYPMVFKVSAESKALISTPWSSLTLNNQSRGETAVAVPPEFEGTGGGYSPEDFYALALLNCFIATFKVIAEKSKLTFEKLNASGSLTVDRGENGAPWMKAFLLKVELSGASDSERALRLLEKASQSCMILNSVKTEKTFEFKIS